MTTTTLLTAYAGAIAASDWSTMRGLLADDATVTLLHTGERFDADGFVAFNRDYPSGWVFATQEVVDGGDRGVLRAQVSVGDDVFHVVVLASQGPTGRLTDLVEVWTEAVSPHPQRSTT